MDDYARAAVVLLDALGIEQASVVGHHTGASIALEMSVRFPDRIDRVVLAGILALETDEERESWRHYLDADHRFELDSAGDFLRVYPLPMLGRDQAVSPDDPRALLARTRRVSPGRPALLVGLRCRGRAPVLDLLPRLRQPVLVLNQVQGRVHELTKKRAAARIPGSRYVELPGGSEGAMDDPRAFAREILAFLARGGHLIGN